MRIRLLLLTATLTLAALISVAGVDRADAARGCGSIHVHGAAVHVHVLRGVVPCPTARRILRGYATATTPCQGSSCLRPIGNWTCQTASYFDFPRLASCDRHTRWIAAYSTAD